VRLWDVETGKELKRFEGHTDKAAGVFSPDGAQVLTFSPDKTLRLWDVATAQELKKLEGHTQPPIGSFSPDGKHALSYAPDQTIRLWDLKTGQEIRQFGDVLFHVYFAGFAVDGRHVVGTKADGKFRIWETASGKTLHELDCAQINEHGLATGAPSNSRLALMCNGDVPVRVLDLLTGKEIHRYENCRGAQSFSFSTDGTMAVAGSFRQGVFVFRLPSLPAGPR
jgi:WD40 repeat protein